MGEETSVGVGVDVDVVSCMYVPALYCLVLVLHVLLPGERLTGE